MTRRQRKIIAYCIIIEEILAISLATFGFFTRFLGAGNPIGTVYIYAGFILAMVGIVIILFAFKIKE